MTLPSIEPVAVIASAASLGLRGFCLVAEAVPGQCAKFPKNLTGPPFAVSRGMPRRPRILYAGAVCHVMARGNRQAPIFDDEVDRQLFLELMGETVTRYGLRSYGYCQMGNHYHQVVATPRGNLPEAMRFLNGVFAQASNRRHGRTGHLFEARYRSLVIQREGYLRRALRYVVLNPVRARLVAEPGQWAWSSYLATAGLEPAPEWLSLDWLEWALEAEPGTDPQDKYRRYVNSRPTRGGAIDPNALVLGTREFRERLAASCRRKLDKPLPAGYRAVSRPPLRELLDVSKDSSRTLAATASRAHVSHGYSQSAIARELGVHPSTISKWLKKLRSNPRASGDFVA